MRPDLFLWPLLLLILHPWAAFAGEAEPFTVRPATQTVTLSGYTRARAALPVAAEVGGRVLAVHYDVGQAIADKPFARIDPTFVDFRSSR